MKKTVNVLLSSTLVLGLAMSALSAVQTPIFAKGKETTYLIAYKNDIPSDFEERIEELGGSVETVVDEVGIVSVTSNDPNFLKNIKKDKTILAAEEELEVYLDQERPEAADGQPITDVPQPDWDDPDQNYHDLQWDIKRITNDFRSHDISKGNSRTVVGIIDTGLDFDHPDLRDNADEAGSRTFVPGTKDAWDQNGHGTHVAGSIAANGKVLGVGPDLTVRAYRVFGASGGAQQSWITNALVAAANDGVDVVNMSLGGWRWMAHNYGEKGESASMVAYKRAVQYAVKKGVTVVVAAGNDSRELGNLHDMQEYWKETYGLDIKGPSRVVPAQIPGVITVSSSNEWSTDKIAFYSNYGNPIDIAAPGGDNGPEYDRLYREDPKGDYLDKRDFHYRALSTYPTYLPPYFTSDLKGYAFMHGTSMAAPKVAGIAAVIKSENPKMKPNQIAALIYKTAEDYGKRGQDKLFGAGEANIYNALTE
ncbi:S8 family serine peptidase [Brevibacillus ruminantium]|uniref:S8 family serine peptidase n=1 Tax=Brevibacillus ruminantium TaxID=2950604 RepID=A0ABY4WGP6_9BACL|nr:S8 family serine peptidase [Brevibacillus ruminantium]USG65303.1 S8 family serine peptidase [Brevibacillus ruminantium]